MRPSPAHVSSRVAITAPRARAATAGENTPTGAPKRPGWRQTALPLRLPFRRQAPPRSPRKTRRPVFPAVSRCGVARAAPGVTRRPVDGTCVRSRQSGSGDSHTHAAALRSCPARVQQHRWAVRDARCVGNTPPRVSAATSRGIPAFGLPASRAGSLATREMRRRTDASSPRLKGAGVGARRPATPGAAASGTFCFAAALALGRRAHSLVARALVLSTRSTVTVVAVKHVVGAVCQSL